MKTINNLFRGFSEEGKKLKLSKLTTQLLVLASLFTRLCMQYATSARGLVAETAWKIAVHARKGYTSVSMHYVKKTFL
jgi:hypothetical protein